MIRWNKLQYCEKIEEMYCEEDTDFIAVQKAETEHGVSSMTMTTGHAGYFGVPPPPPPLRSQGQ